MRRIRYRPRLLHVTGHDRQPWSVPSTRQKPVECRRRLDEGAGIPMFWMTAIEGQILLRNGSRPPMRRREGMGLKDVGDFEDQVARSVIQNCELVLTAQAVEDRKTDTH